MRTLLGVWSLSVLGGCAMLMPHSVALLQPPKAGALDNTGCMVKVAPVEVSEFLLDGKSWADPGAPHALKTFRQRFSNAIAHVDPKNLSPGTAGPLVARPKLTRAVAGAYFKDSASTPSEVWVTVDLQSASGEVLERLESHAVIDANNRQPGFDDRLAEAAQVIGTELGQYIRGQLRCR